MSEYEAEILKEIKKISDLLELLAEDKIAQRDAKQRTALLEIVGTSAKKQKSIFLMDGSNTQADIRKITTVDQSDLSKMVSKLHQAKLLLGDTKTPHLAIPVPPTFFESNAKTK